MPGHYEHEPPEEHVVFPVVSDKRLLGPDPHSRPAFTAEEIAEAVAQALAELYAHRDARRRWGFVPIGYVTALRRGSQ